MGDLGRKGVFVGAGVHKQYGNQAGEGGLPLVYLAVFVKLE